MVVVPFTHSFSQSAVSSSLHYFCLVFHSLILSLSFFVFHLTALFIRSFSIDTMESLTLLPARKSVLPTIKLVSPFQPAAAANNNHFGFSVTRFCLIKTLASACLCLCVCLLVESISSFRGRSVRSFLYFCGVVHCTPVSLSLSSEILSTWTFEASLFGWWWPCARHSIHSLYAR